MTEQNNNLSTKVKAPSSGDGGLHIIKIGGNIIENPSELDEFLDIFVKIPDPKILIHGGGKLASKMASDLGIEVRMTQGRRITDAETLDVITMVYGGKVNKNIVAKLQARGCDALGLSGADGNTILSVKRPVTNVDFGFVGDVFAVSEKKIQQLLEAGLTPVFCAITHDGKGQLLNTNADTIACEIARALAKNHEVSLNYCFEKPGVLKDVNDDKSVIKNIDEKKYKKLNATGIIADGMLPKMHNCFYALEGGVKKVRLGKPSMLLSKAGNCTTLTL